METGTEQAGPLGAAFSFHDLHGELRFLPEVHEVGRARLFRSQGGQVGQDRPHPLDVHTPEERGCQTQRHDPKMSVEWGTLK